MAAPNTRTTTDDLTDALTELDQASRALNAWRTHLDALAADPTPGHAHVTERAKNVVVNLILDAAGHTHQACQAIIASAQSPVV